MPSCSRCLHGMFLGVKVNLNLSFAFIGRDVVSPRGFSVTFFVNNIGNYLAVKRINPDGFSVICEVSFVLSPPKVGK